MNTESSSAVLAGALALALAFLLPAEGQAQELVFQPSVPGFAGSAATQQVNLQLAQAQQSQDQNAFRQNPLENFQQDLQRQILGRLSQQIVQSQFGSRFGEGGNLNLDQPGTFNLGDFVVDVIPSPDALQIRVGNVITGNSTTVTVPRFQ